MLFTPLKTASLQLCNHVVMSPLTRSRASQDNIPTALMTTYDTPGPKRYTDYPTLGA